MAKKATTAATSTTVEGIYVKTAPGVKTFRRAGMAFNEHGHGIALDALSKAQLKQLENESNLVVERVTFSDDLPAAESNNTTTSADSSADHANPGAGSDPAPDARIAQLVEAIGRLEDGNQDHWTKSGLPEIKTLEAITGLDINAELRNQAWEQVRK